MFTATIVEYYRTYATENFEKHPSMFDDVQKRLQDAIAADTADGHMINCSFHARHTKLAFALLVLAWDENKEDAKLNTIIAAFVANYPTYQKLVRLETLKSAEPRVFPKLKLVWAKEILAVAA